MKKYWIAYALFSVVCAFALAGGSWVTSLAQGTVPDRVPLRGPVVPIINSIITAGEGHTCAITPADGLRCWGWNDSGQLGDGTFADSNVPVNVIDVLASTVIDLTAGIKHTCALLANSEVICWGLNDSGQLGNGTTTNSNVPVLVQGLQGRIVAIDGGAKFTCAQSDTDEVFCWGDNSTGQLNDGTTTNRLVATLTDPGLVGNVLMVAGGLKELQGVTKDGVTNFWNNEPLIPVTGVPEAVYEILTAGRWLEGGCSTTIGQDVNCWGSIVNVAVSGASLNRHLLDNGSGHACTVNSDGLVCWGNNSNGQLGSGWNAKEDEVVVVRGLPSVVDLATGMNHTCAIIDNEIIKCWGENQFGQLGTGTNSDTAFPKIVQ